MDMSIVIVNYNGKNVLGNCLASILNNNFNSYEIIIVDNHSTDNSQSYLKHKFGKLFKKFNFIELDSNHGPAYARNQAVKQAKGNFIAFLDNDTEVDPNWLTAAYKEFQNDKQLGCIQSKLLLLNEKNKFDYAGDYLNQFGLLSHRATYQDLDVGQFEQPAIVFAAKSAGMFIRKNVFEKIGGFDNDYFIYMEETDLCWRSWLIGYKTMYCPKSIVYHGYSGSFKLLNKNFATYNLRFHGTKNYIYTIIKNLELKNLITILPKQLIIFISFSFYLFLQGKITDSLFIIKGIIWNLKNLRSILNKRCLIQENRKISDNELFKYIFIKESLLNKINKSMLLKKQIS